MESENVFKLAANALQVSAFNRCIYRAYINGMCLKACDLIRYFISLGGEGRLHKVRAHYQLGKKYLTAAGQVNSALLATALDRSLVSVQTTKINSSVMWGLPRSAEQLVPRSAEQLYHRVQSSSFHGVQSSLFHGVQSSSFHGVQSSLFHGVQSSSFHGVQSSLFHGVQSSSFHGVQSSLLHGVQSSLHQAANESHSADRSRSTDSFTEQLRHLLILYILVVL